MYSNLSVIDVGELCKRKSISVLDKLPQINGSQLVTAIIRPLVTLINSNSNANGGYGDELMQQCLHDDQDVHWIMEVIGFGLGLPFYDKEQIDAVRDCVNIYYDWFHALAPSAATNKFIPLPIRNDPNLYCQKIIGHLYNIFRPRTFDSNDNINDLSSKQALFCHRILRLLISIATNRDNVINATTWECMLIFLLGINEELLNSPIHSEDIGTQIAERVISTLFEGWLLACVACFPSPSYWKTFQMVCANLRHRPAMIIQWNRVNVCLTVALVRLLYNSDACSSFNLSKSSNFVQYNNIVELLSPDALKQSWFRFLHLIGNPIELCFPEIVFKHHYRQQYQSKSASVDATTINLLPFIFHKAIKGLCTLVDIFLAVPNISLDELDYEIPKFQHQTLQHQQHQSQQQPQHVGGTSNNDITPPEKRRSQFGLLSTNNTTSIAGNKQHEKQQQQQTATNQAKINSNRSKSSNADNNNDIQQQQQQHHNYCTLPNVVLHPLPGNVFHRNQVKSSSVLDIFGKWLFQASLIGSSSGEIMALFQRILPKSGESTDANRHKSQAEANINTRQSHHFSSLTLANFEAGQAEAIGALCRIFCFKKCDEDISLILSKQSHPDFQKIKHYLTSYYLSLKFGLSFANENFRVQLLSSILVNCVWLFEVDLPGSKILIPHFLKSIEIFLTKKEKSNSPRDVLIRRACIKILISLLSYPLHFKDLPIRDTLSELPSNTFFSLFPRLILLLIHALHNEPNSVNIQMILGALLFIVEDSVKHEQLLRSDHLHGSNDELTSSLLMNFRVDNSTNGFDNQAFDKYETPCNMFLLILSFVAEILNKSAMKTSSDYNVSLAALDVLYAMGRVHYGDQFLCNHRCKPGMKQIFAFIENQCYKPAMFHSKDMHSTIVAAYQCLSVWIHEHSHLVHDRECIVLLFELIELGISGSKSKRDSSCACTKGDKALKPTSMRVKEAAEFLLTTLMGRMSAQSSDRTTTGATILSCDLNEAKIIEHLLNLKPSQYPANHFRYFIAQNSLLISILERPLMNEETICIVRSPHGKYCWLLQYQHLPNTCTGKLGSSESVGPMFHRCLPKNAEPQAKNVAINYFPQFFDKICTSKFDDMVLKLTDYISESTEIKQEHDIMQNLIDKIENNLKFEKTKLTLSSSKKEFVEPAAVKNFEASRLILSQFKMFNFEICDENQDGAGLIALNESSTEFVDHLEKLDLISTKNNDTIIVFYVPRAFEHEAEIFQANASQYRNNLLFREFMSSLGNAITECGTNLACANILYWSDISHELLFISPTTDHLSLLDLIRNDNDSLRRQLLQGGTTTMSSSESQSQRQQQPHCSNDRIKTYLMNNVGCDIKLLVFWLESMEDFSKLPLKHLENAQQSSSGDESFKERLYVIVINPLRNGLFKVIPYSFGGKSTSVSPTLDRMLLGKHLLAPYIRMTALNLFRRRRMNAESFQLPHLKRRAKIQEMMCKFKTPYSNQDLIGDLFANNKFM